MTHKIGDIVNDMKILDSYRNENGNTIFKCICIVCGKNKDIRKYVMDNNPGSTSHKYCDYHCTAGLAKNNHRLHVIWKNMKSRIYNPNNQDYHNYGGRGLTTDYNKFEDFYNDLHEEYYEACEKLGEKNVSIDRIDNNLGYIKGNIRWSDPLTQARNRRVMNDNTFYCFAPTGEVYISNNKTNFAKNHGFTPQSICDVLYGRTPNVYGWVFRSVNDQQLLLFTPQNVIEEFYY